jgi:multidrug transporter EmrE-like cation transporter
LTLYVLTTVSALVIMKLGTKSGLPIVYMNNRIQFNVNFYTISGIVLYGLSFVTYIYLISKFDLGYILPLALAFVYILIFLASYFIFKEVFTITKIIGIVFILVGLVFLTIKK